MIDQSFYLLSTSKTAVCPSDTHDDFEFTIIAFQLISILFYKGSITAKTWSLEEDWPWDQYTGHACNMWG